MTKLYINVYGENLNQNGEFGSVATFEVRDQFGEMISVADHNSFKHKPGDWDDTESGMFLIILKDVLRCTMVRHIYETNIKIYGDDPIRALTLNTNNGVYELILNEKIIMSGVYENKECDEDCIVTIITEILRNMGYTIE